MADQGQRGALLPAEADWHDLPQRARTGSRAARLRGREDHADRCFEIAGVPRKVVDAFLDPACGDRSGGGRAGRRVHRHRPAPRRARGAHDPGPQVRRG